MRPCRRFELFQRRNINSERKHGKRGRSIQAEIFELSMRARRKLRRAHAFRMVFYERVPSAGRKRVPGVMANRPERTSGYARRKRLHESSGWAFRGPGLIGRKSFFANPAGASTGAPPHSDSFHYKRNPAPDKIFPKCGDQISLRREIRILARSGTVPMNRRCRDLCRKNGKSEQLPRKYGIDIYKMIAK